MPPTTAYCARITEKCLIEKAQIYLFKIEQQSSFITFPLLCEKFSSMFDIYMAKSRLKSVGCVAF